MPNMRLNYGNCEPSEKQPATQKSYNENSQVTLRRNLIAEATNYIKQLETTSKKQLAELEHLRPLTHDAALNVEKIHNLQTQVSMMETLRKRIAEMEIENTLLQKEKSAWNTFLESNDGNQRPEEISRDLHRERVAHKAAQDRVQALDLELAEHRERVRT